MSVPKRVLLVTRNLPPLRGGMERLNLHVALAMAADAQVHVVGPAGCAASLPNAATVDAIPVKPLWKFMLHAAVASVRHAIRQRPDMVIAGSGLTAPIAVVAARIARARSAVYIHGLDITVNHLVYRWLWLPFIRAAQRASPTAKAPRPWHVTRVSRLIGSS